jgi:hypothetical protein
MEEYNERITLLQHRTNLLNNPNRYTQDKERAIKNFAETSYKFYGSCGKNKKLLIRLLQNLGNLVFENQEHKPIYEYQDTLPRAWNSPMNGGWKINYIKWEIGHLISLNQGGLDNPENLSFQSARCNQHIQTSMNYYETTEYNCKEEVKNRLNNLFDLHKSKEWTVILEQIHSIIKSEV